MKCFQCKKSIENELNMIVTAPDGDCFCDQRCKDAYERDKAHFLNVVIHDDTLYSNWLYGETGVSHEGMGL